MIIAINRVLMLVNLIIMIHLQNGMMIFSLKRQGYPAKENLNFLHKISLVYKEKPS